MQTKLKKPEITRVDRDNIPPLGAIFGTGRSGSTWLGAMVSSHPEVAYRFEPFHRLSKTNSAIAIALEQIRSSDFSFQDLNSLYQALLPASPELEKPPFFAKSYSTNLPLGRGFTWSLARKNDWGKKLFSRLYTPKGNPTLIFKEVALVDVMSKLLELNQVPIVYLLRHPCGVVASTLKGQKETLMPSGRRSVLQNLLTKHQPHLAEKYQDRLAQMHVCEQEALLWLMDVERSVRLCQAHQNALVVVYERLVEQPLETLEKIFTHFGLSMNPQSIKFIEQSTHSSLKSKIQAGEIGINKYFSVYRNSQSCRDRWKQDLSGEDIERVMNIVKDSQGYALGAATGLWT